MQKYNILELNEKLLPELQSIAEELGIKKVSSLKKEELVYRILDEQAISYAGIQAEKEKEKEAKKAERQTKAKKTKAAAPKGAKADAKTKVAAPATPVEASVEEVVPEAPEQPERKRRTRIDKKEKVAAAVVPVQKNEEAAVSKSPVSANAPVSETLVQVADATADVPAETVKPAAKKVVKKTDKPVEKPLLPPVVVESDNGELPASVFPVFKKKEKIFSDRRARMYGGASEGGADRSASCRFGSRPGFLYGPAEPGGGGRARRKGDQCRTFHAGNLQRCDPIEIGRRAYFGLCLHHARM